MHESSNGEEKKDVDTYISRALEIPDIQPFSNGSAMVAWVD